MRINDTNEKKIGVKVGDYVRCLSKSFFCVNYGELYEVVGTPCYQAVLVRDKFQGYTKLDFKEYELVKGCNTPLWKVMHK